MFVNRWITQLKRSRYWGWAMVLLALLLAALLLPAPPIADDFFHRLFFTGSQALSERGLDAAQSEQSFFYYLNEMFRFFAPQNGNKQILQTMGYFPWWASSSLQISFWRPISALTHWIDYYFWPESVALMRLQTLVWYGMLAGFVWMLFRRLTNRRSIAMLGSLIFVLDIAHLETISWIAARNGLIALTFGLVAVISLHDLRNRGGMLYRWITYIAFLLSLLAGEAGIASFLLLIGYALFFDRPRQWRGGLVYVPYFFILLGWLAFYRWQGFGVVGSGFYLDPLTQPGEFFHHLVVRAPILAATSLTGGGSFLNFLPDTILPWLAGAGGLVILGVLFSVRHRFRQHPGLCWGMFVLLLATLPVSATTVFSPRLFLFISVGSALVLAYLIVFLKDCLASNVLGWRRASLHLTRGYLIAVHVVGSVVLWGIVALLAIHTLFSVDDQDPLAAIFDEMAGQRVVVFHSPHSFAMLYLPFMMERSGVELPKEFHLLLPGYQPFKITRVDQHTLEIVHAPGISIPPKPVSLTAAFTQPGIAGLVRSEQFYRAPDQPLLRNEKIVFPDKVVTVLDADTAHHTVSRLHYKSLSAQGFDDFLWYVWEPLSGSYALVPPLMIGETRQFAGYVDQSPRIAYP